MVWQPATSALIEKLGADHVVRDMISFVAQRLMELDVDGRCGAGRDKRNESRTGGQSPRAPYLDGI